MGRILGRQALLGISLEGSRGTAETDAQYWLSLLSKSIDDVIEQVVDESAVGVIEDSADAKIVKKSAKGDMEGYIGDKSIGLLLLNLLGADDPDEAQDETTVWKHVFTVLQSAQHPSLTLLLDDPSTQDYKYPLAMGESLELNFEKGKPATFKMGVRSKAGVVVDYPGLTPSLAAEHDFLPRHTTFKFADSLAELGAASAIDFKKCNIKIDQNLEDDDVANAGEPIDINNKEMKIEGSIEIICEEETYKTAMLDGTAKAMRISLTNDDVDLGNASHPSLQIDLARVKFSEVARKMDNKDFIIATLKFKAFYSIYDAQMIEVQLTNQVEDYTA